MSSRSNGEALPWFCLGSFGCNGAITPGVIFIGLFEVPFVGKGLIGGFQGLERVGSWARLGSLFFFSALALALAHRRVPRGIPRREGGWEHNPQGEQNREKRHPGQYDVGHVDEHKELGPLLPFFFSLREKQEETKERGRATRRNKETESGEKGAEREHAKNKQQTRSQRTTEPKHGRTTGARSRQRGG